MQPGNERPETVRCRLCGALRLETVHDFGRQPVAGYLEESPAAARAAPTYVNAIAVCGECGLVQQAHDEAQAQLIARVYGSYQPTYSMSGAVKQYMARFLYLALAAAGPLKDYVLEVGSNDGSVLAELRRRGHRAIGIDPSADSAAAAAHGLEVERDYFGGAAARALEARHGRAGLLLSRHTLEHVFDPLDFFRGVGSVLSPSGLAVIEVPHLHRQLMNNQFQSMTFQHVCFFTVTTLARLVQAAGLQLFDLAFSEMDAGSVIVFAGHPRERPPARALGDALSFERAWRLAEPAGLQPFFRSLKEQGAAVHRYLASARPSLSAAFGAGSKGQALLNMLGLTTDAVPLVIDETPGAAGKFVPGVGTEVVRLDDQRLDAAARILITAPSHIPEIVRRIGTRFPAGLPIVATAPSVHLVTPLLS